MKHKINAFKQVYTNKRLEKQLRQLGQSLHELGERNTPYENGKPINIIKPKKNDR